MIRYAYLWKRKAEAGREEGVKDRLCAIVLATVDEEGRPRVIVLPITRTAPQPPEDGIELPQPTKARLGLDAERSWIIVSEGNDFIWPGPDLRPLPWQGSESVTFGFLPPRFFHLVRDRFIARARARRAGIVPRTA